MLKYAHGHSHLICLLNLTYKRERLSKIDILLTNRLNNGVRSLVTATAMALVTHRRMVHVHSNLANFS
jgi:hypothetical protein